MRGTTVDRERKCALWTTWVTVPLPESAADIANSREYKLGKRGRASKQSLREQTAHTHRLCKEQSDTDIQMSL